MYCLVTVLCDRLVEPRLFVIALCDRLVRARGATLKVGGGGGGGLKTPFSQ